MWLMMDKRKNGTKELILSKKTEMKIKFFLLKVEVTMTKIYSFDYVSNMFYFVFIYFLLLKREMNNLIEINPQEFTYDS